MNTKPKTAQLLREIENGTEFEAYEAAKAISNLKDAEILADLTRILREGKRPYAREAAAYALSWHQNRRAVNSLLTCAGDHRERDSVRGQALEGLAIHLEYSRARSKLRSKAEKLMFRMLSSPRPTLRFWACFGIGKLGCKRAIPRLRKIAATDTRIYSGWWYVREEAEDALNWIGGSPGKDRIPVHLRNSAGSKVRSLSEAIAKRSPSSREPRTSRRR